jgi:hypothetical protein
VLIAPRRPRATRIRPPIPTLWVVTFGAANYFDKMGKFR